MGHQHRGFEELATTKQHVHLLCVWDSHSYGKSRFCTTAVISLSSKHHLGCPHQATALMHADRKHIAIIQFMGFVSMVNGCNPVTC